MNGETTLSRHLPAHEDCALLNVEAIAMHLKCGGTLGSMDGYEERPGQIDMTRAIATAFNERKHLMVEAGTGVGKSLAYLIPAIHFSAINDTPVIIATATRNLQSQLIASDIPRALKTLSEDVRKNFKVALLKGRTNYLCLRAANELKSGKTLITKWIADHEDGDLDEYEGAYRAELSCTSDECSQKHCPYYSRCFVYKARKRAFEANLIVANHSLVLAEATAPASGILPAYGRIILDEAHNLEDIATQFLSYEFSLAKVERVVKHILKNHHEIGKRATLLLEAADEYLRFLCSVLPQGAEVRRFNAATNYWKDTATLKRFQNNFEQLLLEVVQYIHDYCEKSDDFELNLKLDANANELIAIANEAAFIIKGENIDTHAYWVERERLVAAPLSVANELKELLYETKDSVILCSATLRVGNDFKYMIRRLGANDRFAFVTATSPFDYLRQALVLAPDNLPDPATNRDIYVHELAQLLKALVHITHGRTLVLFTSYEMMREVAILARPLFDECGLKLHVQGEGLSREAMTNELKANPNTVIFGAQSFWEGVDIAGEALSCVVIARLPFAQVGDPIVEARSERIDHDYPNKSFSTYILPEAVIKFRQGFGRLIRAKSDRGVVVVTDPRIVTKNYGATFRKSIPASVHTVTSTNELLERVRDFFT